MSGCLCRDGQRYLNFIWNLYFTFSLFSAFHAPFSSISLSKKRILNSCRIYKCAYICMRISQFYLCVNFGVQFLFYLYRIFYVHVCVCVYIYYIYFCTSSLFRFYLCLSARRISGSPRAYRSASLLESIFFLYVFRRFFQLIVPELLRLASRRSDIFLIKCE